MDNDLKTLLEKKAEEMRLDRRLPPHVLRRARRRRAGTAALAGAVTVGLAAGAIVAVPALLEEVPTRPPREASIGAPATGIQSIFPDSEEQIEAIQEQVAEGHMPGWTDPELTAVTFATNVLQWDMADIEADVRGDDPVTVVVANPALAGIPTRLTMALAEGEPGTRDDIYVVTAAETDALDVREPHPGQSFVPGSRLLVQGTVSLDLPGVQVDASLTWRGQFGDGAAGGAPPPGGTEFGILVEVPDDVEAGPVLAVTVRDRTGHVLGQTSFRLGDPEGSVTATAEPPEQALPDAVGRTRQAILTSAEARNWEALRALIPQEGFTFSFGGETDPIAYWQDLEEQGVTVLPTLQALLESPYAKLRGTYIWPAPAAARPQEWTEEDLDLLRSLFSEEEVQAYLDVGTYLGWRVGIDRTGTWVFYVAGD